MNPSIVPARIERDVEVDTEDNTSLVSIILPTYNGARYLCQSIDSCLAQTHTNIEVIVVVDGSTDATLALLAEYCDPRLKVLHHTPNRGLPEALNVGFAQAAGRLMTWTSDDNWYTPDAIAEMVQFLDDHPEIAFVYADMWLVDERQQVQEIDVLPASHLKTHPQNGIYACFLYRRGVYETVGGYDPAARLAEDYDYWLRIAEEFEIAPLHRRLYYYRQHSGSLTSMHGRYGAPRILLAVRRRRRWIGWREYLYWSAYLDIDTAFWHKQRGEWEQVRRMALRGLLKHPANASNLGLWSILFESIFGRSAAARLRTLSRALLHMSPTVMGEVIGSKDNP